MISPLSREGDWSERHQTLGLGYLRLSLKDEGEDEGEDEEVLTASLTNERQLPSIWFYLTPGISKF